MIYTFTGNRKHSLMIERSQYESNALSRLHRWEKLIIVRCSLRNQFYQPGGGRNSGVAYGVIILSVTTNKRWREAVWLLRLMDDHQWMANEQSGKQETKETQKTCLDLEIEGIWPRVRRCWWVTWEGYQASLMYQGKKTYSSSCVYIPALAWVPESIMIFLAVVFIFFCPNMVLS